MGTDRDSLSDTRYGRFRSIKPKSPLVLPHPSTGATLVFSACVHSVSVSISLEEPLESRVTVKNHEGKVIHTWLGGSRYVTAALKLTCKWIAEHA